MTFVSPEPGEYGVAVLELAEDPAVLALVGVLTVLLSSGTTYDELCGVTISGVAELHDDAEEVYPHAVAVDQQLGVVERFLVRPSKLSLIGCLRRPSCAECSYGIR